MKNHANSGEITSSESRLTQNAKLFPIPDTVHQRSVNHLVWACPIPPKKVDCALHSSFVYKIDSNKMYSELLSFLQTLIKPTIDLHPPPPCVQVLSL